MIMAQAFGLAFLELSFLFVILMLLHSVKRHLGSAPFHMALAVVVIMAQVITGAGVEVVSGLPGLDFGLAPTVFLAPLMGVVLVLYIVDGTVDAQRAVMGIVGVSAVFIYLSWTTERQLLMDGYLSAPDISAGAVQHVLFSSRVSMFASLLSILVEFLVLPVVYQVLRNRNCRLSVAVFGALILTQVVDAFFYELVTNFDWTEWWQALRTSYLGRIIAVSWVGVMTVAYLYLLEVPARAATARGSFEIVTSIIDRYGPAVRLQAWVREWEGRYQMVVENTNDCIFIVDVDGKILDVNKVAAEKLMVSVEDANTIVIDSLFRGADGQPWKWHAQIWSRLYPDGASKRAPVHLDETGVCMVGRGDWVYDADVGVTAVQLRGMRAALLVARDVTTRRRLERERVALEGQLVHSQRMEAVGQLAGGVAHDFNNLLHAMQGNLDLLERDLEEGSRNRQLVRNLSTATERAAGLTGQLLGFARGGKYEVVDIQLGDLMRQTASLFEPMVRKNTSLRVIVHPDPLHINGDFTQLEQILLNLLINARDALDEQEGARIICRVEPAAAHTPGWRDDAGDPTDFAVLRVRDNGPGIPAEIREKIFEPFFTTKESKGTGMGLAMAYGCVVNHDGWIHVECPPGKGTEFCVFLPVAATEEGEKEK